MPSIPAVTNITASTDGRRLVDRVDHATPGVPNDGRVHVHLRRAGLGADEIRFALEDEGWTVTPRRGVGGTPLLYLVTGR